MFKQYNTHHDLTSVLTFSNTNYVDSDIGSIVY
jgi:hypothetical protein